LKGQVVTEGREVIQVEGNRAVEETEGSRRVRGQ
jgi:hypothetical protein